MDERDKEKQTAARLLCHLSRLYTGGTHAQAELVARDPEAFLFPTDYTDTLIEQIAKRRKESQKRFAALLGGSDPLSAELLAWYEVKAKGRAAVRKQAHNRRQAARAGRNVSRSTR